MGRRLGQHFLFDPAILDRIVDALEPRLEDDVVEVGPGKGTLTRRLAPRVGSVIAIEKDELLARELQQSAIERCQVMHADALEVDWQACLPRRPAAGDIAAKFKVIGNVPYSITTPLIDKAIVEQAPQLVVFLVQKEVADRLEARPGSKAYGALTVGVYTLATVERVFVVKPGSFRPPPKVDSAVVRIEPRAVPLVEPDERLGFRRFVSGLFGQRRKQLARATRIVSGRSASAVTELLDSLDLAPSVRPEVLTPHELVSLFRALRR